MFEFALFAQLYLTVRVILKGEFEQVFAMQFWESSEEFLVLPSCCLT
jgi:hypothetical protein